MLCDLGLLISGSQFSYLRKHKNSDFPRRLTVGIKCVKASRTLATVTASNCVPAMGTGAVTRCQAPSPAGHQHRSFLQPPAENSLGFGSFMSEWIFCPSILPFHGFHFKLSKNVLLPTTENEGKCALHKEDEVLPQSQDA